jgi:hypothetical protein
MQLKASPALLVGRIHDDGGNRMSPSHSVKLGARYRYYVSQAVIQQRKDQAGSVARVPAPEIESIVVKAVRQHLETSVCDNQPDFLDDRDLIERHVARVVVKPTAIEVQLAEIKADPMAADGHINDDIDPGPNDHRPLILTVPWSAANLTTVKGILHAPTQTKSMKAEQREALLSAIAKARRWIDDLVQGRSASFAEIAAQERKVERLIRLRIALAFTSPRIVAAIIDGSSPADLTVTKLANTPPHSWAGQERQVGLLP